jgi:hypothetical protein
MVADGLAIGRDGQTLLLSSDRQGETILHAPPALAIERLPTPAA